MKSRPADAMPMPEALALRSLAALAQAQRLRAFKALVLAGSDGLTPGVIAAQLGCAPSALSFHLKELTHAGLVSSEQRGRNWVYRANFEQVRDLLAHLSEHCCAGDECALTPASACPPRRPAAMIQSEDVHA